MFRSAVVAPVTRNPAASVKSATQRAGTPIAHGFTSSSARGALGSSSASSSEIRWEMSGSSSVKPGDRTQCQVELAADASSAAPASLATRVATAGVDATPATVQLGAAEGTPPTVNASVTSTPGPIVNSPFAVKYVACNTRAGSE